MLTGEKKKKHTFHNQLDKTNGTISDTDMCLCIWKLQAHPKYAERSDTLEIITTIFFCLTIILVRNRLLLRECFRSWDYLWRRFKEVAARFEWCNTFRHSTEFIERIKFAKPIAFSPFVGNQWRGVYEIYKYSASIEGLLQNFQIATIFQPLGLDMNATLKIVYKIIFDINSHRYYPI